MTKGTGAAAQHRTKNGAVNGTRAGRRNLYCTTSMAPADGGCFLLTSPTPSLTCVFMISLFLRVLVGTFVGGLATVVAIGKSMDAWGKYKQYKDLKNAKGLDSNKSNMSEST